MVQLKRTFTVVLVSVALIGLLPALAFAGGAAEPEVDPDYPTREIEIMVPWGAGGATDIVFRTFASVIPQYLGTSILINNQPGGAAVPGYTEALTRQADGYFFVAWATPSVTVQHMRETPFSVDDFVPVINLQTAPIWILVPADSPYETLTDLVEDAAARPGRVALGNAGEGGGTHLIALAFEEAAGVEFNHVPHDGGGPAVTAAVGAHVDAISVGPPEGVSQMGGGDLRALAVFSRERMPDFPDIPTAVEQGIDFTLGQWRGIAAPAGTPQEYIDHVHDAFKAAMEDSTFQTLAENAGIITDYIGGEEFIRHVQDDYEFWGRLISERGLGERY